MLFDLPTFRPYLSELKGVLIINLFVYKETSIELDLVNLSSIDFKSHFDRTDHIFLSGNQPKHTRNNLNTISKSI